VRHQERGDASRLALAAEFVELLVFSRGGGVQAKRPAFPFASRKVSVCHGVQSNPFWGPWHRGRVGLCLCVSRCAEQSTFGSRHWRAACLCVSRCAKQSIFGPGSGGRHVCVYRGVQSNPSSGLAVAGNMSVCIAVSQETTCAITRRATLCDSFLAASLGPSPGESAKQSIFGPGMAGGMSVGIAVCKAIHLGLGHRRRSRCLCRAVHCNQSRPRAA